VTFLEERNLAEGNLVEEILQKATPPSADPEQYKKGGNCLCLYGQAVLKIAKRRKWGFTICFFINYCNY